MLGNIAYVNLTLPMPQEPLPAHHAVPGPSTAPQVCATEAMYKYIHNTLSMSSGDPQNLGRNEELLRQRPSGCTESPPTSCCSCEALGTYGNRCIGSAASFACDVFVRIHLQEPTFKPNSEINSYLDSSLV